jgi:hypothetical protein
MTMMILLFLLLSLIKQVAFLQRQANEHLFKKENVISKHDSHYF